LGRSAKKAGDFDGGSALGERWHFEDLEIIELGDAVVGVLVEQVVEDGTGLGRVPIPEVLAFIPNPLGTFPSGAKRGVPCDMNF
jgi:hypothetical protein